MIDMWIKKKDCSGCGACYNICQQNAIKMVNDECGFKYPKITENCIECNACINVCEETKNISYNTIKPNTYAAWSKNSKIRYKSTSGGVFSEIANYVLKNNGFVVGAEYVENNLVKHTMISNIETLDRIRQSKYIQSDINYIYREIKYKLKLNNLVAFCGAPCQVAALKAYLGKKYDNLITIDFICRGVNSPKAYLSWLDEIQNKQNKKVIKVWFKYKKNGWKKSPTCTRLDFDDDTNLVLKDDENIFMTGYLGPNLYIRPSCGNCNFKGFPRHSDITLADFWGINEELDDDKGVSMVLTNSSKGKKIFLIIQNNLEFYKRDFNEIFTGNVCIEKSVQINKKSTDFLISLDKLSFSKAVQKHYKDNFFVKIKDKVISIILKLKIKILDNL